MSLLNTFDVIIGGDDICSKTKAAVIIERALEREGFVNIEVVAARDDNKSPTLLELMRETEPRLFEKLVVIQEMTTIPVARYYKVSTRDESTPPDDSDQELALSLDEE